MKQMALPLELIQSLLLGPLPSTRTLYSWPGGCTEEGLGALSTSLGGQQGREGCKPTALNFFSLLLGWESQAACTFNGRGLLGKEVPHQDSPLRKALCGELGSAGGHLCLHREGRRPVAPKDSVSPASASSPELLV